MSSHHEMAQVQLPHGPRPQPLSLPHFPTRMQAVIWRNWEMVPVERLAKVLSCGENTVLELAREMGLRVPPLVNEEWLSRGYVTLIRINWHLLPYEQLLMLLGWTPQQMLHTLHEEDFLWIKLGLLKPNTPPLRYQPLTSEQQEQTATLRAVLQKYFPDIAAPEPTQPFDFLRELEEVSLPQQQIATTPRNDESTLDATWRIVYPRDAKRAHRFVHDFIAEHAARWGMQLQTGGENTTRVIQLTLQPDAKALSESHAISLQRDRIEIAAVDEVGLLRGLQWLESTFIARGGPHFSPRKIERQTRIDYRNIHPYSAVYGDALLGPDINPIPDGLLSKLSKLGVNGLWTQGILYQLYPWRHAPQLSEGYQQRLESLRRMTERAAQFGIGVYLYFNEPRCLPRQWFRDYLQLQQFNGVEIDSMDVANLCTSLPEVQDYLRQGSAFLFREVPELAGAFTITMSENLTNCYSRGEVKAPCPRCSARNPGEVVAEVNRFIAEGAHSVKPDARVIAWAWGWDYSESPRDHNQNWGHDAIRALPEDVSLQCTSEEWLPTNVAGIPGNVIDYSISQVGPSPLSRENWRVARECGLKAVAKVQLNCTWEISAVPYVPVPDLVEEHLQNLDAAGVSGLQLSWTLGGYPSPNLELAARRYWTGGGDESLDHWASRKFGAAGEAVRQAQKCFSAAFREFPFHISGLYNAPYNFGPMNLLHAEPTGYAATMIGFPYDALDTWRAIYPREVYEAQFRKLSDGWNEGLKVLSEAPVNDTSCEALIDLQTVARACWIHFRSTHNQIAFIRRRDELKDTTDANARHALLETINTILDEEIELARQLHDIIRTDSRIGYEASNHYYYSRQDLREKVLSCEQLKSAFMQISS